MLGSRVEMFLALRVLELAFLPDVKLFLKPKVTLSFFFFLFPCFPVFFCVTVFFLFFGYSHFDTTFLTEATAYVLHIPCVEHLRAILASVIAHDFAFA
jgi:hypothetical protein